MHVVHVAVPLGVVVVVFACSAEDSQTTHDAETGRDAAPDAGVGLDTFRVATLNLRNNEDYWMERFDLVAEQVNQLRPHVLAVQELQIGFDNQTQALFERLQAYDDPPTYHVYEELKSGTFGILGEGLAIYSQFPFEETDVLALGEGRIVLFARVQIPGGGSFDLYNVHLDKAQDSELQRAQVEKAMTWVGERSSGRSVALMGDFNANPQSTTYAMVSGSLKDAHLEANPGDPGLTFSHTLSMDKPVHNLRTRIDFIFYSIAADSRWQLDATDLSFNTPDETGLMPSDHVGVTSVFSKLF